MARTRKISDIVVDVRAHTVMIDDKFAKLLINHRSAVRWAKKRVTDTNKVQVADGLRVTDLWKNGKKVK